MLRDVFYLGNKPNAHPREKFATSLENARLQCSTDHFWVINEYCDYRDFDWDFDFEFLPDEDVWAENHNNVWPSQHQKDSGTWLSPKEYSDIVLYRSDVNPIIRKNEKHTLWKLSPEVDESKFDFSWHPDPTSPPYIYKWGCKFFPVEIKHFIEYAVPSATNTQYMNTVVELKSEKDRWKEHYKIDHDAFDFTWRPNPLEPPFIYVWSNKWVDGKIKPTLEYVTPGATEKKHLPGIIAVLPDWENWEIHESIDKSLFDFSWHPDPTAPPYIYVWGNQWNQPQDKISIQYNVPGASEYKFMEYQATRTPVKDNWEIPDNIDIEKFDFSWEPNPNDPPMIYQFGTQWQKTGGPRYVVTSAVDIKYVDDITAVILPDKSNWIIPKEIDTSKFDFSWHPDNTADPAIYQFGSISGQTNGPRYIVPNNTNNVLYLENVYIVDTVNSLHNIDVPQYFIKTTLDALVAEHPGEIFWALNNDLDYTQFDFSWRPDVYQSSYIHSFGSKENLDMQTYFVNSLIWENGKQNINYVEMDTSVSANLDMFFIDRGNKESSERYNILKKDHPKLHKTRYLNTWANTITRCANKSTTSLFWILNSELDYSDFKFDYYPNSWQMKMLHVFGTQWSNWGTTFLVSKEQFPIDTKYVKIIEHLQNLNFVKATKAKATKCLYDIILIDHGNPEMTEIKLSLEEKSGEKNVTTVKYHNDYLTTLKDAINHLPQQKEHYVWICSSICDYTDFDFSYICDPFAKDQLHVFPSDSQKFGDTFFVDVNKAKSVLVNMILLEEFNKINYNANMKTHRLAPPMIVTEEDSLVTAVDSIDGWPYAILSTADSKDIDISSTDPMSLWSLDTKNIIVASTGGSKIIVPKEARNYVDREIYDYPYIKKSSSIATSNPMDIVFLSNGESGAEDNWEHLKRVTKNTKNRVIRVDGVNGRVAAYRAAVEASNTPWAFTVFAKLKVDSNFNWAWQPDRMQIPKHYIFQAKNPVNGLVYGHQAAICYNKNLVLQNEGHGLDFTLDDEHEVVDLLSGVAVYNTDPFSTWRTSFREVLKLRADNTAESQDRLNIWLTEASGNFAEFSLKGASDAMTYYDDVSGEFNKLKLSYEWEWLNRKFTEFNSDYLSKLDK